MITEQTGNNFCNSCGVALKPGARFCEKCGQPVKAVVEKAVVPAATAAPAAVATPSGAAVGTRSPDGKWWWDGRQWIMAESAPVAAVTQQGVASTSGPVKKKPGKQWRNILVGIGVAIVVLVGILWATGEFAPASHNTSNSTSTADKGLGAGPIYDHFNCGGVASCMALGGNELTAKGGNTGIFEDWSDLASCKQSLIDYPGLFNKEWCSTSKNPADTGP